MQPLLRDVRHSGTSGRVPGQADHTISGVNGNLGICSPGLPRPPRLGMDRLCLRRSLIEVLLAAFWALGGDI